ncbi:MAG: DUF420 domain-containing protein [Chloroflexi bacterium AL-W]|nr:DUF420 domain-containing protein [Chloroflexi bacterium AL-W]
MNAVQGKLDSKRYVPWIWAASIGVPILVGVLLNPKMEGLIPFSDSFVEIARKLPFVNAVINSVVSILLVTGYVMIRQRRKVIHQRMMISAFVFSAIFLITYVTYHLAVGHVGYCEANRAAPWLYYIILLSHIGLSVTIVPLASFSIFRALNQTYDRHMKLARITFPLWLYVSVTGVLVVLMNAPCY